MDDHARRVHNYPVTVEGDTTIVYYDDWDGVWFRLPWLATDEQVAAVASLVEQTRGHHYRCGQQEGRAALASELRHLLGIVLPASEGEGRDNG